MKLTARHLITHALRNSVIVLGTAFIAACSGDSVPGDSEEGRLYRPVQGLWSSHWTPDRKHAEDHLRAHNEEHDLNGGVVEYR